MMTVAVGFFFSFFHPLCRVPWPTFDLTSTTWIKTGRFYQKGQLKAERWTIATATKMKKGKKTTKRLNANISKAQCHDCSRSWKYYNGTTQKRYRFTIQLLCLHFGFQHCSLCTNGLCHCVKNLWLILFFELLTGFNRYVTELNVIAVYFSFFSLFNRSVP